jgi:hypothetical protein
MAGTARPHASVNKRDTLKPVIIAVSTNRNAKTRMESAILVIISDTNLCL